VCEHDDRRHPSAVARNHLRTATQLLRRDNDDPRVV